MACYCAISQLDALFEQLKTRSITVADLQKIVKNMEQMKRLCRSATAQQMKTGTSVDEPTEVTFEAMTETIDLRTEELEYLKSEQGRLLHLCEKIQSNIQGI